MCSKTCQKKVQALFLNHEIRFGLLWYLHTTPQTGQFFPTSVYLGIVSVLVSTSAQYGLEDFSLSQEKPEEQRFFFVLLIVNAESRQAMAQVYFYLDGITYLQTEL